MRDTDTDNSDPAAIRRADIIDAALSEAGFSHIKVRVISETDDNERPTPYARVVTAGGLGGSGSLGMPRESAPAGMVEQFDREVAAIAKARELAGDV